jgi:hypothetical protein
MAFTGWAQLAVLQSAMDSLNGLNVKYMKFNSVYTQSERELIDVSNHYSHSIYGMLILALSFKSSKIESKKFVIKYVFKNFYRWHLFSRKWNYSGQLITKDNYLAWNQLIAEALIRNNSISAYYLYKICKIIPFEVAYKVKFFMFLKRKFDILLKQPSPTVFR